ncbi:hypothetical protein [Deinococcus peraridilitoris]|uniref:Uncharacterized protein n=1 Tax=Deinococcus peraridilitoris (strain DSM 19664 / LMG 22246 / CIP 109416 / KR-200) TaxID=937777 RepID=L0A099_DEIPD|nr:hypothetical protein [Deinococcus peraridilitoris]AFZ66879.1 hypothetical protein Deipe_1330 [Deinococcus peraridilitoris DSM 19664]
MPHRAEKQLDDTIAALQSDVTALDAPSAIDMLETWQSILVKADFEGAEDIGSLLVQLQSQLELEEPEGSTVAELLSELARLTQSVADEADDETAGKVQLLSDALSEASESLE